MIKYYYNKKAGLPLELEHYKVSFIISTFNMASTLERCIDSILQVPDVKFEIICVDDGSSDNTSFIIKDYSIKYRNFRALVHANCGLASSRNAALDLARGEYIQFIDADDFINPLKEKEIIDLMRNNNLDMLTFSGLVDNNGKREKFNYWEFRGIPADLQNRPLVKGEAKHYIMYFPVSSCLTIYRKSFLDRINNRFPDGKIHEDNVFYTNAILQADRFMAYKSYVYLRTMHPNQITKRSDRSKFDLIDIFKTSFILYLKFVGVDMALKYANFKKNTLYTTEPILEPQLKTEFRLEVIKFLQWCKDFAHYYIRDALCLLPERQNIKNIDVSIVVPCYNAEENIVPCLNSILKVNGIKYEIICIDDGSEDGTFPKLAAMAKRNKNIKALAIYNHGPYYARTYACQLANGKYLQYVDSDDFIVSEKEEEVIRFMEENQLDLLTYSGKGIRNGKLELINTWEMPNVPESLQNRPVSPMDIKDYLFFIPGYMPLTIYRKAYLDDIGNKFPSTRTHADTIYLYNALLNASRYAIFKIDLYRYRLHENQISRSYGINTFEFLIIAELAFDIFHRIYGKAYAYKYVNYIKKFFYSLIDKISDEYREDFIIRLMNFFSYTLK